MFFVDSKQYKTIKLVSIFVPKKNTVLYCFLSNFKSSEIYEHINSELFQIENFRLGILKNSKVSLANAERVNIESVDANRKINTVDYTIFTMDEEKKSSSDKQKLNLSTEINQSNKSDKLLNANQQSDSFSEHLEIGKSIIDKKSEINQSTTNDNHTKRQKSLCYDFKKGNCRRRFCRVGTTKYYMYVTSFLEYCYFFSIHT